MRNAYFIIVKEKQKPIIRIELNKIYRLDFHPISFVENKKIYNNGSFHYQAQIIENLINSSIIKFFVIIFDLKDLI